MGMALVDDRFGSWRGAVRLALAHAERWSGRAGETRVAPDMIRRLVFVCQGNICRSAYADSLARQLGLETASFGLSTSADKPAHIPAIKAARQLGVDLSAHRTTRAEDFALRDGDLLLAMEARQLRRIAADPRLSAFPRVLLGRWAGTPHLHDPYGLGDAYFLTCLRRIDRAVRALAQDFPAARSGG